MQSTVPGDQAPPAPTPAQLAVVDAVLARLHAMPGALLPVLHAIQDELGFVPPAVTERIANGLNLSIADVHGVITFYHDFRRAPPGRMVVKLCRAEACQSMGCRKNEEHLQRNHGLAMGATTPDGALTLEPVYCLGNCALSPAALVDGEPLGRVDAARLDELVAAARRRVGGA